VKGPILYSAGLSSRDTAANYPQGISPAWKYYRRHAEYKTGPEQCIEIEARIQLDLKNFTGY